MKNVAVGDIYAVGDMERMALAVRMSDKRRSPFAGLKPHTPYMATDLEEFFQNFVLRNSRRWIWFMPGYALTGPTISSIVTTYFGKSSLIAFRFPNSLSIV